MDAVRLMRQQILRMAEGWEVEAEGLGESLPLQPRLVLKPQIYYHPSASMMDTYPQFSPDNGQSEAVIATLRASRNRVEWLLGQGYEVDDEPKKA